MDSQAGPLIIRAANRDETVEISTQFLAELLSMAKKPTRGRKAKPKCSCRLCPKPQMQGCRELCYEDWKTFRRDKARVGAAVTELTAKEQRLGITLEQKKKEAMQAWDDAQVALGRIAKGHRGFQRNKASFGATA